MNEALRGLPAVHRLLGDPRIAPYVGSLGQDAAKRAVDDALEGARRSHPLPSTDAICQTIVASLERRRRESLLPVINATGVLLHTNLGRAPLSKAARAASSDLAGYVNLEYDLESGTRGSRYGHVRSLICALTGAADALVVNNCAAAVLLVADTFARGRETIVSRNQSVEIGGGFRIPDVLARSGSTLVEVGTTNKVRLEDFERAFTARTGLVLRTHASNFRTEGFVEDVASRDLARLCRSAGVVLFEDVGSGALVDLAAYGLPHQRTVAEVLSDGADLVAFSGDKLVGGPQAGILAGSRAAIARVRENPLVRALRVGKQTIAALSATLRAHASPEGRGSIPLYAMLGRTPEELRRRAGRYVARLGSAARTVDTWAYVGGGTLPQERIASVAVALRPGAGADRAARTLRSGSPPIVARIESGELIVDLRAVADEDDEIVLRALSSLS